MLQPNNDDTRGISKIKLIYFPFEKHTFENNIGCRGVARNFSEGGSKSSKMFTTMLGRRIKFWVAELLK